jgi:hypothetical protein
MARRQLQSQNKEHVTQYFEKRHEYLETHNFFHRLNNLKLKPNHKLAERLDRTFTQSALYAEQTLPQFPDIPFSPHVARIRNRLGIYKALLYQHHHNVNLEPEIQNSIQEQYDDFDIPNTLEDCKSLYDSTLQSLKLAEKEAILHRRQHLQLKRQQYADLEHEAAEKYIKRLQQCEDLARVYSKCAYIRGKHKKGGFTTIEVPEDPNISPKTCTKWRTVDCPK